ncbi:MAG: glycosyltransferase family 4 protein [Gammaproteobacteria bacterium]|nr:glycosyltransferase family 4 protein [Gammaproteobacteria bacterium]
MLLNFSTVFIYNLLAFVVALAAVYFLSKQKAKLSILDQPNERSLHSVPVNRTGGLGIFFSIMLVGFAFNLIHPLTPRVLPVISGMLIIVIVSFMDDVFDLSVKIRLFFQAISALLLITHGMVIGSIDLPFLSFELPEWLAYMLTFLLVIWCINLYNFMDGMDGFAGGMAVIGFTTFTLLAWIQDAFPLAILSGLIASASAGFLVFNFPPAKIFMGDAGSSMLGFLMAALMIWADNIGIIPVWLGVLVFSPFILDATFTLFRRLIKREKVWEAHRTHLYQRFVVYGWSHKRTVLLEYLAMLVCSAMVMIAVISEQQNVQLGILFVSILFYLSIFSAATKIIKN